MRSLAFAATLAASMALRAAAAEDHGDNESAVVHALEEFDSNSDGLLSRAEVGELLEAAVAGADWRREHCPNATAVLTAAGDGTALNLTGNLVAHEVPALLFPCMMEATCAAALRVEQGDAAYKCTPPEGGHHDAHRRLLRRLLAEDDHDHDHGGEEAEAAAPAVTVGGATWECVKEEAAGTGGTPLSQAEVWGLALLATVLVSISSLIGLLLGFPAALRAIETSAAEVSAFAGGALIGGVLIHLLPEALAKPGALDTMVWAVPTGFCASFALQLAAEAVRRRTHRSVTDREVRKEAGRRWYHLTPLAFMIVFGDLWHNLSDGIVIAISFHSCSAATGWLVTAAIMLHEVPQEISDFAVLLLSGLSVPAAAAWNLISALTALIGCVAALIASDAASSNDASASAILIGSGMLLYIGATDVLPLALPHHQHSIHTHSETGTAAKEVAPPKLASADKQEIAEEGRPAEVEMKASSDREHEHEHGHGHGHGHNALSYPERDAAQLAEACAHAAPDDASLSRLALRALLVPAGMGLVALSTLWHVHCDA